LKTLDELKMIVMEELCGNLVVHNIQITYCMPYEVLKNQINYKYMAIETNKHVKMMFDKLERIPEVNGSDGVKGGKCGIGNGVETSGGGGGGGCEERVETSGGGGGGCEERVGISGAMMVVNNMKNRANMVEIFGFWSWR